MIKFIDDNNRVRRSIADMNNLQPRVGFAYAATTRPRFAPATACSTAFPRDRLGRPGTGFTINSPVIWSTRFERDAERAA